MATLQFKTNIKCGGCINTVTPYLNNVKGIEHWEVDITNPDRVLTISGEKTNAAEVVQAIEQAGYKIEPA